MLLQSQKRRRRGTTLVECAVVYPTTFFILLTLLIGAIGVFRYQEMAALAREASRYAASHGGQYRQDSGLAAGSAGTSHSSPVGSAAPYNVAPWTNMLWYTAHPTEASGAYATQWADIIYDQSVRGLLTMLEPADLQFYVGWEHIDNLSAVPDNWPGAKVAVNIQYPVMPEWAWYSDKTTLSVSTSPMLISN